LVERTCKAFSPDLFSHFANYFLFIFAEIDEGLHIERDEPERRNENRKPKMKIKELEIGAKYQTKDCSSVWIKTGKTVSKRFGTNQPSLRHDLRINCVVVK
jgi:hypothetical protein